MVRALWLSAVVMCVPQLAQAESVRRIVLWPSPGAPVEAVQGARQDVRGLGQIVGLPEAAAGGSGEAHERLEARAAATVRRGINHYYVPDFEAAVRLLEPYVNDHAAELAANGCMDVLRDLLLWLGASLARLGRADEASGVFTFAVAIELADIDRATFSPEVTEVFDAARRAAGGAELLQVSVRSQPPGATVEIDGTVPATGRRAPTQLSLAPGRHVLVVRRPGYSSWARTLRIGHDQPHDVEAALEVADQAEAERQVAVLRRDGDLDSAEPAHLALVALATAADVVVIVGRDGTRRDVSAMGEPVALADLEPMGPGTGTHRGGSGATSRPVWRRWWFWVALVGGAAVAATAVGLGVHYGTQERDTFTLVPRLGDPAGGGP